MSAFGELLTDAFNQLLAGWTRIEPRARSDDISEGVAAKIADPLFLLGRQWQLGEHRASDAGSPLDATVHYASVELTHARVAGTPVALRTAPPLETLVEREAPLFESDFRLRVLVAQELERRLRRHVASASADTIVLAFLKRYALQPLTDEEQVDLDRETQRFVRSAAGFVVDGRRVWEDIASWAAPVPVPAGLGIDALDAGNVSEALTSWRDWLVALYGRPGGGAAAAWDPARLEYSFELSADDPDGGTPAELLAEGYRRGDLDWHSVSIEEVGDALAAGAGARTWRSRPLAVSFAGMPDPRFWAFEDHRVDFGALDIGRTDLARMMLMELALVCGDDWFVLPLPAAVGSLVRISRIDVTDVFGQTIRVERMHVIDATPRNAFDLFALSSAADPRAPSSGIVFIPPALGHRDESPPLEEVRIVRDEMANLVWGVEHTVQDALGRPVRGVERLRERRALEREVRARDTLERFLAARREVQALLAGSSAPLPMGMSAEALESAIQEQDALLSELAEMMAEGAATEGTAPAYVPVAPLKYEIGSTVPANWIPYVPQRIDPTTAEVVLRQGRLVPGATMSCSTPEPPAPRTRIVAGGGGAAPLTLLREETAARSGLVIKLRRQRARGFDGRVYTWLGRSVVPGRGAGSSGLRFDFVKGA